MKPLKLIVAFLISTLLPLGLNAHGADGTLRSLQRLNTLASPTPVVHNGKGSVPRFAVITKRHADQDESHIRPWCWNPEPNPQQAPQVPQLKSSLRDPSLFAGSRYKLPLPAASPILPALTASLRACAGWPPRWPIRPPPTIQSIV